MMWKPRRKPLLAGFGLAFLALAILLISAEKKPPLTGEPAIEFYTRIHSDSYGGIDRWAWHGMQVDDLVQALESDGYTCLQPRVAIVGMRLTGLQDVVCTKTVEWPLRRTLSITASIDYDAFGRLIAARASSVLTGPGVGMRGLVARLLRAIGWIEAAELRVGGFEIDSPDVLIAFVLDALNYGGWRGVCERATSEAACVMEARRRRAAGFAPPPDGAARVGHVSSIETAMSRIGLLPLVPRGTDEHPADSLIVRVDRDAMWLDFVGKDLAGRALSVSIRLSSEGGKPVGLEGRTGGASRMIALAGEPRLANGGAAMWLVPLAATGKFRYTRWLVLSRDMTPSSIRALATELPQADPAFIPSVVQAVVANVSAVARPDESLGLYPVLRQIESRADHLRAVGAANWFPEGEGDEIIRQTYRTDAVNRAAWALARCAAPGVSAINADCWRRLVVEDAEVCTLLRQEVDGLLALYAPLDATHPLRQRLLRFRAVLPEVSNK